MSVLSVSIKLIISDPFAVLMMCTSVESKIPISLGEPLNCMLPSPYRVRCVDLTLVNPDWIVNLVEEMMPWDVTSSSEFVFPFPVLLSSFLF